MAGSAQRLCTVCNAVISWKRSVFIYAENRASVPLFLPPNAMYLSLFQDVFVTIGTIDASPPEIHGILHDKNKKLLALFYLTYMIHIFEWITSGKNNVSDSVQWDEVGLLNIVVLLLLLLLLFKIKITRNTKTKINKWIY